MSIQPSLKKIAFFTVTPDLSSLNENERSALAHCVKASKIITEIFLCQLSTESLRIREDLRSRSDEEGKDLLDYFEVNGGPWDVFGEKRPFIKGVGEKPRGGAFYPKDLTEEEWKNHLKLHPEDRESFESNYTVIVRDGDGLRAVPYSEYYAEFLEEAASHLQMAASFLPDGKLRKFLELRAEAFLSNDYFESDMAWVDTDGRPFEVTIGPYEVYEDALFGLKAMFESFVALPATTATVALQKFSSSVPEFDKILSKKWGYKPKGAAIPLEVVSDVFRGGEGAFGRQFVAYNLPNDRRIHDLKGSKKVFSRTMMEAKFTTLAAPLAKRVLEKEDQKYFNFENRLLFVLCHELSHGLGPSMRTVDGREVSFEVLLSDLHSTLEEAKADMLGIALLRYFFKKGLVTEEEVKGCVVSQIVEFVKGWRASYTEAHSAGSLVEYNWLKERGAVRYEAESKTFRIDYEKTLDGMVELADALLELQSDGDYEKARSFMKKWAIVSPEIPELAESFDDLPVEVHPTYQV